MQQYDRDGSENHDTSVADDKIQATKFLSSKVVKNNPQKMTMSKREDYVTSTV